MKILQIIDNIKGGGKEQRMIQLSKGLVDKELEVEVLLLLLLENKIDYSSIKKISYSFVIGRFMMIVMVIGKVI